MDRVTKEQRSKIMQSIRGKNTKIEILLGKKLWAAGHRYRKNDKSLIGTPDFTMKRHKLAIFCDSEFWHCKDWDRLEKRISSNREYWIPKFQKNIARDKKVNIELQKQGWTVLRFWETEIKNELDLCLEKISIAIINSHLNKT